MCPVTLNKAVSALGLSFPEVNQELDLVIFQEGRALQLFLAGFQACTGTEEMGEGVPRRQGPRYEANALVINIEPTDAELHPQLLNK